jgi:hypothetical protein
LPGDSDLIAAHSDVGLETALDEPQERVTLSEQPRHVDLRRHDKANLSGFHDGALHPSPGVPCDDRVALTR